MVVVALVLSLTMSTISHAATFIFPVQSEQVITGTTTGLGGAPTDDGVRETLHESDTAPDSVTAPATQALTTGTMVAGTFPGDISSEDGVLVQYREAVLPSSDHYPGTETLTTGSGCGGTFPTSLQSSNNVYRCLREAGVGGTSIAFDAASSAQGVDVSSFSWTHTTSGTNRLLFVGVAIRNDLSQTVSSITYAGTALTFVRADTNGVSVRSELWYLVGPATGANTVQVILSAAARAGAGAISLTGVAQTTPLDANNGATGSSTTPSVSVTTVADNAWVVDAVAFRSFGNGLPTGTAGAGQTERWSEYTESGGTDPNIRGESSTEGPKTPAGGVVMSWSLSDSVGWSISGAAFKPVPADFRLSVRHDWSGIPTDGNSYDVCVEAHITNAGGESMLVQVLTPPATWNTRITVSKTADDNADQCYTLTTTEFNAGAPSIRWIGSTETGDSTQSDVNIDHERIIRRFTNYRLDVTYDWTGVPSGASYVLSVKGYRSDEDVNVQVLTPPATWNTRLTVNSITNTLFTYTLTPSEYNGGSPQVRFLDVAAADPSPSDMFLDWVAVTTIRLTYSLEVRQNVTGIITGSNPILVVKGNISAGGENFHVHVWNFTSLAWALLLSATFTATNAYHNSSLAADHLSGGTVRVRFVDGASQDSTRWALSLDFVAVAITNEQAVLTNAGVSPASGNITTSFTFFVRYSDPENNAPAFVNLTLDGTSYAMVENNSADTNYVDGKDYFLNRVIGIRGTFNYSFSARASAGDLAVATTPVRQVSVMNRAPSISNPIASDAVHTGRSYVRDFNGTDPDNDTLVWSLSTNAPWLAVGSANGTVWGVAPAAVGVFYIEVGAVDGFGGSTSNNYTLSVGNLAPSISNPIGNAVSLRQASFAVDFNALDSDGDALTWSLRTNAGFLSVNIADGTVTGLTWNAPATYWVEVTVSDGFGGTDRLNFSLIVVNRPPQAIVTASETGRENELYEASFSATDPDSDPVGWSLATNATWLTLDPGNAKVTGIALPGVYYVNLTASDPFGGVAFRNFTVRIAAAPIIPNEPDGLGGELFLLIVIAAALGVLLGAVLLPRRRQIVDQAFLIDQDSEIRFHYSTPGAPFDEAKLWSHLQGQPWREMTSVAAHPHTLHVVRREGLHWVIVSRSSDASRVIRAAEKLFMAAQMDLEAIGAQIPAPEVNPGRT